jgi:hypothetical protein
LRARLTNPRTSSCCCDIAASQSKNVRGVRSVTGKYRFYGTFYGSHKSRILNTLSEAGAVHCPALLSELNLYW